jgi:hypothetical protein
LVVLGKSMVVPDIAIIHIRGQKPIRINFDMSFYLLFYTMIFFAVMLIGKVTNKRLPGLKISVLSFLISACFLLVWNFALSPIYFGNDRVGGVSSVLSSLLSVAILALCSIVLGVLHYFYKRIMK